MKLNTIKKKIKKENKGAAMLVAVIFLLFISIAIISGLIVPSVREYQTASENINSKRSYFLAESGVEDALYRILTDRPITSSENITLGSNSTTTTITSDGNQKEIVSLGDVLDYNRKVNISVSSGKSESFGYGLQAGQGGVVLDGSSGINGNVYANGTISGCSSCFISGTAVSANSPALNLDQSQKEGDGSNIYSSTTQSNPDLAQSFQLSSSGPVNKVSIYVKKNTGTGPATIKIVNDSNGSPGSIVYAMSATTGNVWYQSVFDSYVWKDVSFTTNPLLYSGTTYWIVLDNGTASATSYYSWQGSVGGRGYANGVGKRGTLGGSWYDTTPSGQDLFFKVYTGGVTGLIQGTSQYNQLKVGTAGTGSARAATVNFVKVTGSGNIYCHSGGGNNKSCVTNEADPSYVPFPISDGDIQDWKDEASTGGTYSGNYNTPDYGNSTLGPKLINGNLNVGGSHTLYVTGTLWVKGNVTVSGSGKIVLDASYGASSGVIVADGWLDLGGSGKLNGTGQTGSYILFATTSYCDVSFCSNHNAIDVSGSAGSVVLYAPYGTVSFLGSARAKAVVAYKMSLSGSTEVNYETGLESMYFSGGSSGGWSIGDWKETQ